MYKATPKLEKVEMFEWVWWIYLKNKVVIKKWKQAI